MPPANHTITRPMVQRPRYFSTDIDVEFYGVDNLMIPKYRRVCSYCVGNHHTRHHSFRLLRCSLCINTGHIRRNCQNAHLRCSFCQCRGHSNDNSLHDGAYPCPKFVAYDYVKRISEQNAQGCSTLSCVLCGKRGHIICSDKKPPLPSLIKTENRNPNQIRLRKKLDATMFSHYAKLGYTLEQKQSQDDVELKHESEPLTTSVNTSLLADDNFVPHTRDTSDWSSSSSSSSSPPSCSVHVRYNFTPESCDESSSTSSSSENINPFRDVIPEVCDEVKTNNKNSTDPNDIVQRVKHNLDDANEGVDISNFSVNGNYDWSAVGCENGLHRSRKKNKPLGRKYNRAVTKPALKVSFPTRCGSSFKESSSSNKRRKSQKINKALSELHTNAENQHKRHVLKNGKKFWKKKKKKAGY